MVKKIKRYRAYKNTTYFTTIYNVTKVSKIGLFS